jgi:hypothetical protein
MLVRFESPIASSTKEATAILGRLYKAKVMLGNALTPSLAFLRLQFSLRVASVLQCRLFHFDEKD